MARIPKYLIIDDFLPEGLHGELLDHALRQSGNFTATGTLGDDGAGYDAGMRLSSHCRNGLGPLEDRFIEAVSEVRQQACSHLGMPKFKVCDVELELVAHRHGDFFKPHIDTATDTRRKHMASDRMLTLVYYFHARPKGFGGGELAMLPFGPGEPVLIEPRDNRLLAFPSFAAHEVRPVECPGGDFSKARFAVNCWLHRARAAAAPDQ